MTWRSEALRCRTSSSSSAKSKCTRPRDRPPPAGGALQPSLMDDRMIDCYPMAHARSEDTAPKDDRPTAVARRGRPRAGAATQPRDRSRMPRRSARRWLYLDPRSCWRSTSCSPSSSPDGTRPRGGPVHVLPRRRSRQGNVKEVNSRGDEIQGEFKKEVEVPRRATPTRQGLRDGPPVVRRRRPARADASRRT